MLKSFYFLHLVLLFVREITSERELATISVVLDGSSKEQTYSSESLVPKDVINTGMKSELEKITDTSNIQKTNSGEGNSQNKHQNCPPSGTTNVHINQPKNQISQKRRIPLITSQRGYHSF